MKVFYSPSYAIAAHPFETTRKSGWIAELLEGKPIAGIELVEPKPTSAAALSRVHDLKYVDGGSHGQSTRTRPVTELPLGSRALENGMCLKRRSRGCRWGGTPHPPRFWVALERASPCASSPRGGILYVQWPCPRCPCGAQRRRPHGAHSRSRWHCGGGTHELIHGDERIWQMDVSVDPFDRYKPLGNNQLEMVRDAPHYLPRSSECPHGSRVKRRGLTFAYTTRGWTRSRAVQLAGCRA